MTSMQAFLLGFVVASAPCLVVFAWLLGREGKRLRVIAARAASYAKLCSI